MTLIPTIKEKQDLLKIECNSTFGKGFLYVTPTHFILEAIEQNLIYFEILHTQIATLTALNDYKAEIKWVEDGNLQTFTFRISDAFTNVKCIVEKYHYENNFIDLLGDNVLSISDKEMEKIYDKRIYSCNENIKKYEKLRNESTKRLSSLDSSDSNYEKEQLDESQNISKLEKTLSMWNEYKEDIHKIHINRNKNTPKDTPNHLVWFDCWYDGKTKCYISFNSFLKQFDYSLHKDVQEFNKTNTIPNVIAIPEECVGFSHGYPCILSKFSKQFIEDTADVIIPSMTDEMLNDNLISKWHGISIVQSKDENYEKIPITIHYYTNKGSRIILTNNTRIRYSQKEKDYLMYRKAFPEKHKPFLP